MLSKFSVKKPLTVIVGVILAIVLGVVSYMNMTTDLLPSMDLPYVAVITTYPGASPEKIETSVTKPLEQVLATTSGIKNINSVSSENSSMVILEYEQGTNMDSTMIDISSKIDLAKSAFDDMVGSPMIIKVNPDMLPIMIASVDVNGQDVKEISKTINDDVIPAFERIEGVASVTATGAVEEKVQIELNQDKIDELNDQILKAIDEKMAESKSQLDSAEQQINDAKIQLEKEGQKQQGQIIEGQITLSATKMVLDKSLSAMDTAIGELKEKQDKVISDKAELEAQIAAKKENGEDTSKEELKLTELNAYIDVYNNSIEEMEKQKAVLSEKVSETAAGEQQLDAGQDMLSTKLAEASIQLDEGKAAIQKGKEQFESASDVAYKQAGLTGMLSKSTLSGILTAENFSMPAGYIEEDGEKYLVKVGESFSNIDEINNLELADVELGDIGTIKLSDIAEISYVDNSKDLYAKINGNDGVLLSFQKQSTASTAEVSKLIRKAIDKLQKENPDMHITPLSDQGVYIDIVLNSVMKNLLMGGILAIVVLYLFLRDIKPTVIVALSIPISLITAVALMYFTGVTMNIISLAGLALGVGMLVDNSIVVIENIYRLRGEGMSAVDAAVYGAKQVSGAIAASTLTTVCVFLPIVFTDGISKQLFVDMGLTIAYSLLASLVIALTLVPTMSSAMLKNVSDKKHRFFDRMVEGYEKLLRKTLEHKSVVLIIAVALLVFSAVSAYSMGTAFIPESDSSQITMTLTMPKGSKTEETSEMGNKVIDILSDIDDIETVGAMKASGGSSILSFAGGGDNSVSFYIILKDKRKNTSQQVSEIIRDKTKDLDCDISVSGSSMDLSALGGSGISIEIKGRDMDKLQSMAKDIASILENTEGTTDVSDGLGDTSTETRVIVDKSKALKYGLTVAQVYQEVSKAIATEAKSTTLSFDSKDYPVILVDNKTAVTRDNLKDYEITATVNGEEKKFKLSDIASIEEGTALDSIKRTAQSRCITVTAGVDESHNVGLLSREIQGKLSSYSIDDGYSVELKGENETITKTLNDIIKMIILAIIFIYLIMVAQFQSFLSPFIVIFTIPLAFTGGLLALLITGSEISMISMLGFLVLSGVVVNNGIVFVDYANQLREAGMEKREALITTGRARIRPILMTAVTTILGLSTLALGIGEGADMLQPMAIVTIGGLTYATILTLFVVPSIYDIMNRKKIRKVEISEESSLNI